MDMPQTPTSPDSAALFASGAEQAAGWRDPEPAKARTLGSNPKDEPKRLLVALGDSWFAYWPYGDVIDVLKTRDWVDTKSFAWAGCTLAQVLKGRKANPKLLQLERPAQTDQLMGYLRGLNTADRARVGWIAVSAGGNDVAGNDGLIDQRVLAQLVAQAGGQGSPLLNGEQVDKIVHGEMKRHCAQLLGFITQACADELGARVPIVLHGYGYPWPDGRRAVRFDWLRSVLGARGYKTVEQGAAVMKELIDELNQMQIALLDELKLSPANDHLQHIDLRRCLAASGAAALADWQNELHPSIPRGFEKIADHFWAEIHGLKVQRLPLPSAAAA